MKQINCVFITASKPKAARHLYLDKLARSFASENIKVIVIYDHHFLNSEFNHQNLISKSWPSRRPTSLVDLIFIIKLILQYKPNAIISSFGSVAVTNIAGYLMRVRWRVNFLLSTPLIFNDDGFFGWMKKVRKKRTYNLANLFLPNSNGVLSELEKYYGMSLNPNLILPNLIDDDFTFGRKRKRQLIIVGALSKLKGHAYLIEQFIYLLNSEPDLKLIIVGDGSEMDFLKKKYRDLILSNKIVFKGKLNRKKTLELISESIIHVSSSVEEAFGFVNIESLMQSTPIICSVTSGSKLILEENYNGEFFELHEEDSLKNAYLKIISNWSFYSNNARKSFLSNYCLNENIRQHRDLILSQLNDI